MKPGDLLRLEIERLAAGGDGIAHAPDGRVVFVALVAPGDRVAVRLTDVRARFARGRVESIEKAGPGRTQPPCPVYGVCGGCAWQHLEQEAQEAAKAQILVDALVRIGGLEEPEAIPIHAADPYHYRERARVQVRGSRVGFLRSASHELCETGACPVLAKPLEAALDLLAREPGGDREVELTLSEDGTVVQHTVGAAPAPSATIRVGEDLLEIPAGTFLQANAALREELADWVHDVAGHGAAAVELHAGSGLFTLGLARRFARLTAVESDPRAAQALRDNLERAGLVAEVRETTAEAWLEASGGIPAPDAVVLDPPRSGLGQGAVDRLAALGAARIVYVSCDPATLARDLRGLTAEHYRLERVEGFDLFPQTPHLETVAVLARVAPTPS